MSTFYGLCERKICKTILKQSLNMLSTTKTKKDSEFLMTWPINEEIQKMTCQVFFPKEQKKKKQRITCQFWCRR